MKSLHNLSYKTLFTIFFFAIAGIIFFLKIGNKNIPKVSATWWDSSWNYRKMVSVTNSSGVGQTNILVKVINDYNLSGLVDGAKLQSDLDDIRFTDSDNNLINYWIEDATNSSADIWIRLSSLPSSGTTIWMYYGNPSASSGNSSFFDYTGTKQILSNANSFRIKFLNSGTLVPTFNMTIDAFLVGGGSALGGGGYTLTTTGIGISGNTSYSINVGVGGTSGGNGAASTAFGSTANPGNGNDGGSGAGASGYTWSGGTGGSDGTNGYGSQSGWNAGVGQHTTTHEFGESTGDLYAGGGGGGGGFSSGVTLYGGVGGNGGGGHGAGSNYSATNGTPNTGGGAGLGIRGTAAASGGSGIVILRYTSPSSIVINSYEENNLTQGNTWWSTNWRCRRSISVPNPSSTNQSNVIVKIIENYDMSTLISEGKIKSNLDDIRFIDSNGNYISYWIQDSTASSVSIWATLPSLSASGDTVWMYYSNPGAPPASTPLYNYTGTSQFISYSNSEFRIRFLDSGTFTVVTSSVYDAFLVGGGGSGKAWSTTSGAGGGGAGYTTTISDISLSNSTSYSIVVGAGGGQSGGTGLAGEATLAFNGTVNGGRSGTGGSGGAGGSGGGGHNGGLGGSDGSDGETKNLSGGTGQHTTTREFGDPTGEMYAYGGNAFNNRTANGTGGLGASYSAAATAGAANSGSGGGACYNTGGSYAIPGDGGSGIVVVRYNPFSITTTINNDTECLPPPVSNCVVEENPNDTQLTIKWVDNSSNEEGFYIQKNINNSSWETVQENSANTTSYVDNLISSGNTYQYRISPHISQQAYSFWCYTSVLTLGKGNFDFQGINLEGVNLD